MRKYLGTLGFLFIGVVIGAVRYEFFVSDAEKQADQAKIATKVDNFLSKHDSSGTIAKGTAMVSLMTSFRDACQATITSANGHAISDEDKKSFCECAGLGMLKLYYAKLPNPELIERAKTGDRGPAPIQKEVFAACNVSRHAYAEPPSSPQ